MSTSRSSKKPQNQKKPKEPTGLAPRAAALKMVEAVFVHQAPLETDGKIQHLEARDRSLARAIASTTVRRRGQIDKVLKNFVTQLPGKRSGALVNVLRIGCAQLLFMDVPAHAAVSTSMELVKKDTRARHFAKLANGVLRNISREIDNIVKSLRPADALPEWISEQWANHYGEAVRDEIAEYLLFEPYLDIRAKKEPQQLAENLGGKILPNDAIRLASSTNVTDLPGFKNGDWWVQDFAAQLAPMLLGNIKGKKVADLCAAPGGKTAYLVATGAIVTAVDQSASRLKRLKENMTRLNLSADVVTSDIKTWEPQEKFDAILLDAPCSATGTARKHPDVLWLKTPEQPGKLAKIQRELLKKAAEHLKAGGTLIYCTCSLEPEEGEHILNYVKNEKLPLKLKPIASEEVFNLNNIVTEQGTIRTLPSTTIVPAGTENDKTMRSSENSDGMAGFFIARFSKTGENV